MAGLVVPGGGRKYCTCLLLTSVVDGDGDGIGERETGNGEWGMGNGEWKRDRELMTLS